jgi:hypothetical protein
VSGTKNLIIGKNNKIKGNNNYIFTQNFDSSKNPKTKSDESIDNALISDGWMA